MGHGMEDYIVADTKTVKGHKLGLYAIFDGHSGRNVADYLQSHLFDNILSQVSLTKSQNYSINILTELFKTDYVYVFLSRIFGKNLRRQSRERINLRTTTF